MKTLTKGHPLKVILLFAVPLYIGQLFQLCYSLIDTRIIGSALGEASLAAVGTTTSLSDLLIEFLNGIICGFGVIIARVYGAGDESRLKRIIGCTVTLSVLATLLISGSCLLFLPEILKLLNVEKALMPGASAYIRIIIAGLLATTLYNICTAVLRSIGDSFTPLIFLILANLLNIGLDCLFVYGLDSGVAGAATATVIAQILSALLCFLYMRQKYPQLRITLQHLLPDSGLCRELVPSGLSMGFMISFVTLGSLALQTCINTFGSHIIVAHTAARKVTMIFLIPFFVLGTALATYCGQNLGAKEYARIHRGIRDTIMASFLWCILVILIVFTLSPALVHLVTASSDPEILETAALYLKINAVFYFLPAAICILRNSMQGFGDTKTPLVSSLIELAGKVLIAFLLAPVIGYMGVIISEPIVWALMIVPLLVGMKLPKPIFPPPPERYKTSDNNSGPPPTE
ncbi:MAG: MATE family efflux transporter [Acetatifactor sp.]|nr:MATE family efflux transporter [Acetatifactor sp.]